MSGLPDDERLRLIDVLRIVTQHMEHGPTHAFLRGSASSNSANVFRVDGDDPSDLDVCIVTDDVPAFARLLLRRANGHDPLPLDEQLSGLMRRQVELFFIPSAVWAILFYPDLDQLF